MADINFPDQGEFGDFVVRGVQRDLAQNGDRGL